MKIEGEEHELFRAFAQACAPVLAAGYEHNAKENPEKHAHVMQAIADERAVSRLVVTWDRLYVVVNVDAAGVTESGEEVSLPIFQYRMRRELPPGAH